LAGACPDPAPQSAPVRAVAALRLGQTMDHAATPTQRRPGTARHRTDQRHHGRPRFRLTFSPWERTVQVEGQRRSATTQSTAAGRVPSLEEHSRLVRLRTGVLATVVAGLPIETACTVTPE
jgi:hypothetical protein